MNQRDHLAELGAAVRAYLSAMRAAGECVSGACPGVGEPFGQRILKLHSRLAFDPTAEAVRQSVDTLQAELKDFSTMAAAYNKRLAMEVRRGIAALEQGVDGLDHCTHLFASELSHAFPGAPADGEWLQRRFDIFTSEIDTLLRELRAEMRSIESRLVEGHLTDPATGLMTRKEAMRHIDALRADEVTHTLLTLHVANPRSGGMPAAVLRQVAAKLAMLVRHQDLVARWGDTDFLIVFRGIEELARARAGQIVSQLAGSYPQAGGPNIDISVTVNVEQILAVA